MKDCCIVIIQYKDKLYNSEELRYKNIINTFKGLNDIVLVCPNSMNTDYYKDVDKIYKLDDNNFESIKTYNTLCTSFNFYELFVYDYKYILITQTDVIIFKNDLQKFIDLDYDWYGAPWPHLHDIVGNGGFSLRKIKTCYNICSNNIYDNITPEDCWFCINHKDELNVCPLDIAIQFSLENCPGKYYKELPMGCHQPWRDVHSFNTFWIKPEFATYRHLLNN